MNRPILDVTGLRVAFGASEVVHGIDFAIAAGEVLAIIGESGSGKSATALGLTGLLGRAARIGGQARLDGLELIDADEETLRKLRGRRIGFVFQEPMQALNPLMSIGAQIEEVLRCHDVCPPSARPGRIRALLAEVGLDGEAAIERRYPHQLSGGQQQRAMIAMALAGEPVLLIADEPTTALDMMVQGQILRLIAGLARARGLAVLLISHDLGLVNGIADQVLVMRAGSAVEQGRVGDLLQRPRHPYTRALLAAAPGRRPVATHRAAQPHLAVEAIDLSVTYPAARGTPAHHALTRVSLRVDLDSCLGIVGGSGSGKTTLVKVMAGLVRPDSGSLRILAHDIAARIDRPAVSRLRQVVFQDSAGSLNPRRRIADTLIEPLEIHGIGQGKQDRRERAGALLAEVGLASECLERYPHQLSGGQRQRVNIARALAVDPRLLICDEPVSSLDMTMQAQILALLARLRSERQLTLIVISHDLEVVRALADRVLVLDRGHVVEEGPAETVMEAPRSTYTAALVAAMPERPRFAPGKAA